MQKASLAWRTAQLIASARPGTGIVARPFYTASNAVLEPPATETAAPASGENHIGFNISQLENARHSKTFWAVEPPLPITEPPRRLQLNQNTRFVPLCFDNGEACYRDISTTELVRSVGVFTVCGWSWLVKRADWLFAWSDKLIGWTGLPQFVVRHTFFAHFCAGEDQQSIQPSIKRLNSHGVGAILDYAAESDVHDEKGADSLSKSNYDVIVRTYSYESEKKCDSHVGIFMKALDAAKTLPGQGFAAIKVTALGDPELLKQLSRCLAEVKRLFSRFDANGDGHVPRDEFFRVYDELFVDEDDHATAKRLFARLHTPNDGHIDYVSFVDSIKLEDIPAITSKCRTHGPLKSATPTPEELTLMSNMIGRVRTLCRAASDAGLRIMIDAEHQYFQPAIDSIAKDMMAEFNKDMPTVLNTYQCYLQDSRFRINSDIESARRQGYKFGAKLVRGAYMVHEQREAEKAGLPNPIHSSIADTHANYNRCVRMLIQEAATQGAEVMIATHNQYSVEVAVRTMHDFGLRPDEVGVFFGQLLGMADHLSLVLGRHGYRAYKYVPFGPLREVMPYLIRRAQENSDIMGGVGKEMGMLKSEVARRITGKDMSANYAFQPS